MGLRSVLKIAIDQRKVIIYVCTPFELVAGIFKSGFFAILKPVNGVSQFFEVSFATQIFFVVHPIQFFSYYDNKFTILYLEFFFGASAEPSSSQTTSFGS